MDRRTDYAWSRPVVFAFAFDSIRLAGVSDSIVILALGYWLRREEVNTSSCAQHRQGQRHLMDRRTDYAWSRPVVFAFAFDSIDIGLLWTASSLGMTCTPDIEALLIVPFVLRVNVPFVVMKLRTNVTLISPVASRSVGKQKIVR